jgi:hypothetical protein
MQTCEHPLLSPLPHDGRDYPARWSARPETVERPDFRLQRAGLVQPVIAVASPLLGPEMETEFCEQCNAFLYTRAASTDYRAPGG